MSGETEKDVSGWTTDTLAQHLAGRIDDLQVYMQSQLEDLRNMLQERYETQTKAVDAAFLAQQTAMQTALTAAERAVATALLSAEKAVTKAEVAADKRFDSVNEFRAQLADQAATFLPRKEADVRIGSLIDKVDAEENRNNERLTKIELAFSADQGKNTGTAALYGWIAAGISVLVSVIVIVNLLTGK